MATISIKKPKIAKQRAKAIIGRLARLEARVSIHEKKLFKRAAALQGRTLTEFLVSCAHDAAKRTVQEHEVMELSARDQKTFIAALLKPPTPGKRLREAAKRYKESLRA